MRVLVVMFVSFFINAFLYASPNPASVNCIEQGGELHIRQSSFGEYGVCVWTSERVTCEENCLVRSECEEWAFFRGQCQKNECRVWRVLEADKGELRSYCAEPL